MTKYVGQYIEYYENGQLQSDNYLRDVGKDSKGIWHFTTQQVVAKFVELSPIMEE